MELILKSIVTSKDLYKVIEKFETLPDCLKETEMGHRCAFQGNWKEVFGSEAAQKAKEVVYIWVADKPIPRLQGESRIVYIGKTDTSISERHFQNSKIESTGNGNILKYPYIIKNFGPIKVLYHHYASLGISPRDAENRLLWWYFENHLEYPPINYTKAKKPGKSIEAI